MFLMLPNTGKDCSIVSSIAFLKGNCYLNKVNILPSETAISYTVKGYLRRGKSPNRKNHNLYYFKVGKKVLAIVLIALTINSLSSETFPRSLNVE